MPTTPSWYMQLFCWCPGGSLLERRRANGVPHSVMVRAEREKESRIDAIQACRDHNLEIAVLSARGYTPGPAGKPAPDRALLRAFERDARPRAVWDQTKYWPKEWFAGGDLPGRAGNSKSPASGSTPDTAATGTVFGAATRYNSVAEFNRTEIYASLEDAHKRYITLLSTTNVVTLKWTKADVGYHIQLGFSGRVVRDLRWREIVVPKIYKEFRPRKGQRKKK